MPSINDLDSYSSPYLSVADVTRAVRVNISEVTVKEFEDPRRPGEKTRKLILTFAGARKGVVLNKTSAKGIAAVLGDDYETWIGKPVIVSTSTTPAGAPFVLVSPLPVVDATPAGENPFS